MRRIRMMGLCLIAAFAMGAIAAGSASALPEVGRCVAQAGTGKYTESNCVKKAGSKTEEKQFEFKKGAGTGSKAFTSKGGEGVLTLQSGNSVRCKTQAAAGEWKEASGAIKEATNVVATFTGCELLSTACTTEGEAEGVIVTKKLGGKLGYIKKSTKLVGQELHPLLKKEGTHAGNFAIFKCGAAALSEVREGPSKTGHNCIIAPVEPVNVMSTTGTELYSELKAGEQNPQKFETSKTNCNLEASLNGGPFEKSSQALTTTVTMGQALEIKA
jgi:hypothetical protein